MPPDEDKIVVESVNHPGKTSRVDAAKYTAMKQAMRRVLPRMGPGLTQAEIREQVVPHLPVDLYPAGATAGRWAKTVQLDTEAKAELIQEDSKPLRWHLAAEK